MNPQIPAAAAASRQNRRACCLQFTDSKPFQHIAHSFKILRCSVSKSSLVSISSSSSARCACTQRTSCGWAFSTAPPPCPADRQRVQHRAHTAALGKAGSLGAAGNHHTVRKQAACGLQGVVQKGLCAKFGQQLAAPKVPPRDRCDPYRPDGSTPEDARGTIHEPPQAQFIHANGWVCGRILRGRAEVKNSGYKL